MDEQFAQTTQMVEWVARIQAGDDDARGELICTFQRRLEMLVRKMIGRDRRVCRWVDAEDVYQNAMLRLLGALKTVKPGSMRDFFGLAAEQMRRELIDLARHFYGPRGLGTNHESVILRDAGRPDSLPFDPPAPDFNADDLRRWSRFHEEVERLPVREREVVGLVFYHGWTQAQVAELFQIDVRTVRRWWETALLKLHSAMNRGESADKSR